MVKEKSITVNGFVLRVIAMITMIGDHAACSILPNAGFLRCIARIGFPIYAFLLAEGFLKTKHDPARVKNHLVKLIMLAVISEFCYDFFEFSYHISQYPHSQSAMVTLLLGYLGMIATEKFRSNKPLIFAVYLFVGLANYFLAANFKLVGAWLVIAFYWYLQNRDRSYLRRLTQLLLIIIIYIPIYHWARFDFCAWSEYKKYFIIFIPWYVCHLAAPPLLAAYDGTLGYSKPWFKKCYTYFYPVHLLILSGISMLLYLLRNFL